LVLSCMGQDNTCTVVPLCSKKCRDLHIMWVPVTTAWCVLRLQMEETASRIWKVATNILNKSHGQSTEGVPLSQGFGEGLTTRHRKKKNSLLRNV
jgi:hypothetical protein